MKFKVTEFKDGVMTVEYANGQHASITVPEGSDKGHVTQMIHDWGPKTVLADDKFPIEINKEEDLSDYINKNAVPIESTTVDYRQAREDSYPQVGSQLDALYWSRQGDDSKQKAVDDQIKAIKERYPKDMKPFTEEEWLDELKLKE
tara:strand:- start:1124 stop:1561 length:438 start_codon:yes stop_codon:yes gene_type:complete